MVQHGPVQVSVCQVPGCGAPATTIVATGPSAGMYVCVSHIPRRAPQPPADRLPVVGFVCALLIPIVGVFLCHSEVKLAESQGRDNQLARAGFYFALVSCILGVIAVVVYGAIFGTLIARELQA